MGTPGKISSWVTGETVSVVQPYPPGSGSKEEGQGRGQDPPQLSPFGQAAAQVFQDQPQQQRGQTEQSKYNGHGVSFSVHEDGPVPDVEGPSALQTF